MTITNSSCVGAGEPDVGLTAAGESGGVPAMTFDEHSFSERIETVLQRFATQNGRAAFEPALMRGLAHRLWWVVCRRGLPRPLAAHERGEPGGLPEAECMLLVAEVLDGVPDPLVSEGVRQLVKACFHPEFKTCRDSFREVSPDGSCRRQELGRVLRRVSGTHCVDCPHWVALNPDQHVAYLSREWRAGPAAFAAHRNVYLPEDFRALRRWLHGAARAGLTLGV